MNFILALLQAAGIAAAIGIRPLMPTLLTGAGSVADVGDPAWVGMVVGLVCVSIGLAASVSLFARVRRRLDPEAASFLPLFGEGAALVACGVSILFPPLALLVLAALAWLVFGSRRREGEKYAGL